jgi:hypothetical protein
LIVGFDPPGLGSVRDHPGDVVGGHETFTAVLASVQKQVRDPGDLRGSQLQADRPEREAKRTA